MEAQAAERGGILCYVSVEKKKVGKPLQRAHTC